MNTSHSISRDSLRAAVRSAAPLFLVTFMAVVFIGCGGTLPQVVRFDTRPEAPFRGDTVLLEWIVRGADKVTLDGVVVPDSGNMRVVLDRSRDFTLKATATRAEYTKILEILAPPK